MESHSLRPIRSIFLVSKSGTVEVQNDEMRPHDVGLKAYGLTSLPAHWVPPFFVISSECCEEHINQEWLDESIRRCRIASGFSADHQDVIVRSSGTGETMQERGRLDSEKCIVADIRATIKRLTSNLPCPLQGTVHWVIQQSINPKVTGHLSNERHLKKEHRDWAVEFDPQNQRLGTASSIAIRKWRDGERPISLDLNCTLELQVTLCLKKVAHWAVQFNNRIHFEWLWDGTTVWIVQADVAESVQGSDPLSLLPKTIPVFLPENLKVFKQADCNDFNRYRKLKNAHIYSELQYRMPTFYILDKKEIINSIMAGVIPPELDSDLEELTKRPLIIRTDGLNVPDLQHEMLPRSDELRTTVEARHWLLKDFKSKIEQVNIGQFSLCLVVE